MKNLKCLGRLCLCLCMLIILTGCKQYTSKTDVNTVTTEDMKIGILLYRFDDQFIAAFKESILRETEVLNKEAEQKMSIEFYDGKNQQDIQTDQITELIDQNYDVLAINLVNRNIASSIIDMAKEKNIPVVFFNRQPVEVDMARWDKVFYVGALAEESGRIQGDIAGELWNKHPEYDKNQDGIMQYVLLEGQPEHQDALLRSKFSINRVTEMGIEVEELARDTANWQRSEAKDKMDNWLSYFGEQIEFIFSNNDTMALGAIDAMNVEGITIPIIGVDAIPQALTAIEKGQLLGTVRNNHQEQAKEVMALINCLAFDRDPRTEMDDLQKGTYLWVPYERVVLED